jgi:PAS domain S-box-containing protein
MFERISTILKVQSKTGVSVMVRKKWFREFAEDIPQLVWASDENGRKTFCSRRYLDFTGAADLGEMDRCWTEFIHPEDREATRSSWMHSISSGEPYSAEYRLRRRDGSFRYVKAQALPSYDRNGRIRGWLGMSNDIDDEKAEKQAKEQHIKLVAVRRFASSIAHEINNPLEAVTNALYLAMHDDGLGETARDYLRIADAELHRLSQISVHSLRFHQQSRTPVRRRPSEILDGVLAIYGARLNAAGIGVLRDYQEDPAILCFADDISQMLASLIRNSIDATTAGGSLWVRIRNRTWKATGKRPEVRITIADNGSGIEAELLKSVFKPFFTTRNETHTGLALWITRQIVLRHRGRISFRTCTRTHRHGTVFAMELPLDGLEAEFAESAIRRLVR